MERVAVWVRGAQEMICYRVARCCELHSNTHWFMCGLLTPPSPWVTSVLEPGSWEIPVSTLVSLHVLCAQHRAEHEAH